MRALPMIALFGLWLAVPSSLCGQNKDQAKALLERTLKAAGGVERIDKHAAVSFKIKGKIVLKDSDTPTTGEISIQHPNKYGPSQKFCNILALTRS